MWTRRERRTACMATIGPAAPGSEGVGEKRARLEGIEDVSQHKPPGMSNEQYLNELLAEHEKHKGLTGDAQFPHSNRLLVAEIERVTAGSEALAVHANWKLHEGDGITTVLESEEETGTGMVKAVLKVFIPEECTGQSQSGDIRGGTSRGRLLGPNGQTIRVLQQESHCKMQIKGRGSIKLRENQDAETMATDPQFAHLTEDLHVYAQYEGDKMHMGQCYSRAVKLIRLVLTGGTVVPSGPAHMGLGAAAIPSFGAGAPMAPSIGADQAFANSAIQLQVESGQIVSILASHREMGGHCKTAVKVFVPQRTVMGCSRGKLLGTRGSMLKQLMQEAGCHFAIRGRGSTKEEPAHLVEELHVLVEYEGPVAMRDTTLHNAEMLIRAILSPAGDPQPGQHAISQYELMKQQLQQQQQTFGFGSAYGAPQPSQQQQFPHAALPSFQPLGFDSFGQQSALQSAAQQVQQLSVSGQPGAWPGYPSY